MRAKRTTALLAGTIAAVAGLTLAPTVVPQAAATSVAHEASDHPIPAPKPTKTRTPYNQGQVDGRVAGKSDGADCNYRQSYAPKSSNSKYVQGYRDAYERNYDATCDED
ncbi:hypothetical protein [Streptomyces sp. NBC_00557]|uniref:hypothetical protein n=1 Tax=Streptomyces sp. NBC_00557 TaxID=2975776 RepID=UPI002E8149FF|nr:hypothetical protein [Streptomyces sp. NBC_00557]WUC35642.1 hypothetical protein OG956_16125 [Streptomyces sp. NBC_00557]